MLSRVAESIYWLSRYIERAEHVARLMDVNMRMALDIPMGLNEQWLPVVATTGDRHIFEELYGEYTRDNVIQFLSFDERNPNSILTCLSHARENARTVREILASDMWTQINTFYLNVRDASRDGRALDMPHEFSERIKMESNLFIGLTVTSLTHGEPWHFCRLGRLIERADKTTRILDMKYFYILPDVEDVGTPLDAVQWAAILRSASGFEAYRKRYGILDSSKVVDFLLLDREFPRAVNYCLNRAVDSLHQISGSPLDTFCNSAERLCGQLRAELVYMQTEEVISDGLHEFLDGLQARINKVGEAIFDTFFATRWPATERTVQRSETQV